MKQKSLWVGASALAVAWAVPSAAREAPIQAAFVGCDGFRAPGALGKPHLWLVSDRPQDKHREKVTPGKAGIAHCDAALASPLLSAKLGLRRAHLLQGKAIHQLSAGQFNEALATLGQSDVVGGGETYFDGSIGQGNRALRAVALFGLTRPAEAEALLVQYEARRPFAISQRMAATRVRLQFADKSEVEEAELTRMASFIPSLRPELFWRAMATGQFQRAIALQATISFDDPASHGRWTLENAGIERYLDLIRRVEMAGALSYALIATGHTEKAAQQFADAQNILKFLYAPPPAPRDGKPIHPESIREWDMRKAAAKIAEKRLEPWRLALSLRREAGKLTLAQMRKEVETGGAGKLVVLGDLFANAKIDEPGDFKLQAEILAEIARVQAESGSKALRMEFAELVELMPRPESPEQRVVYASDRHWAKLMVDGYGVKPGPGGAVTVRFATSKGTMAMADEGALYAAAKHVRKSGKAGFYIKARTAGARSTKIVSNYNSKVVNDGYQVDLLILPVNEADLTGHARTFFIPADPIIRAVEPSLLFEAVDNY